MITKEAIKTEIDKVQDGYLEVLYKIIKVFEGSGHLEIHERPKAPDFDKSAWHDFVKETYGCLADDPIERGEQGIYEMRNDIK